MLTNQTRFTRYDVDARIIESGIKWTTGQLPSMESIATAGFDPHDRNLRCGVLEQNWCNHPAGAVVFHGRSLRELSTRYGIQS